MTKERNGLSRANRYLPLSDLDDLRAPAMVTVAAKPALCALVQTVEAGRKVIWLSEGFPVDRSRYGRITLERYEGRR